MDQCCLTNSLLLYSTSSSIVDGTTCIFYIFFAPFVYHQFLRRALRYVATDVSFPVLIFVILLSVHKRWFLRLCTLTRVSMPMTIWTTMMMMMPMMMNWSILVWNHWSIWERTKISTVNLTISLLQRGSCIRFCKESPKTTNIPHFLCKDLLFSSSVEFFDLFCFFFEYEKKTIIMAAHNRIYGNEITKRARHRLQWDLEDIAMLAMSGAKATYPSRLDWARSRKRDEDDRRCVLAARKDNIARVALHRRLTHFCLLMVDGYAWAIDKQIATSNNRRTNQIDMMFVKMRLEMNVTQRAREEKKMKAELSSNASWGCEWERGEKSERFSSLFLSLFTLTD